MTKTVHPVLTKMIPVAKGIAETFGSNCEVVIHDFSNIEQSIVAIFNGHVTGRTLETRMSESILEKINKHQDGYDVYNYTGKSTLGRELKSTTTFIRNFEDEIIGCMCINFDITDILSARNLLNELSKVDEEETIVIGEINKINDVLYDIVENTIHKFGRPVIYLNKDEKVSIVKDLEDKGVFLIKGAIDYVANSLQVSRYTIYNYLDGIRDTK
ncbi:helix-turn-helix transcriptional regulator [Fusibacter tunisiensis]|uniref:Transcriptional regulator YheO n=1 Tax=Fusibacter tunisiensis TaxID=1008308 RepID=A0ABS2MMX2_9FIRM|nr:PAS domain-containing protein [Fusibacter tunisiensis]MBM7560743.1 putative transcriptional regulator YheO [Fusibacter tunisiensis]